MKQLWYRFQFFLTQFMFENLSDKIDRAFKILKGQGKITEVNVSETLKEIRKALGDKIRNQARIIPELIFYIDEVEENAMKMDALIKSLNIPPASKEE